MKFIFSCLRSAILGLVGLMFLFIGLLCIVDAITLLQARSWPVVAAHLDGCAAQLRYGKSDASWELTAEFSYGPRLARHFNDVWTPDDSPTYTKSQAALISAGEVSAITKRFCDRQAAATLRVSTTDPVRARRSEAVDAGDWKADLGGGLVCVLMGGAMCAIGWALFRRRSRPGKTTRASARLREPAPRKTRTR